MKIYHLNIGQPDLPTPQKALDAIKKIDKRTLEYSPSQDYKSLREALVNYYERYQIKLSAADVIITSGGSETVLFAVMSCLNPGDEIIVPEPAYANYIAFAVSVGTEICSITTTIDYGFCLPKVDQFEGLVNDRTKAILICNPNNSSGYLYSPKEMNLIRDLVKKYNLYLFSDEVCREFIYTGAPYISAMYLDGIEKNVVHIDSVSKPYSECGIRIGALITKNESVRRTVMKFCQVRLPPPLIDQIVAEVYSRDVYEEYIERRNTLVDGINHIPGCYTPIPMGVFYTVAKLPVYNAEKFCTWCLSNFRYADDRTATMKPSGHHSEVVAETIMMAPAAGFYTTPDLGYDQVRLVSVLCKGDIQRALMIFFKTVEQYNSL